MTPPRWRYLVIGVWIGVVCLAFITIGSMATRSWLLLLVVGLIPPVMLLWLWNEDRPNLLGTLRTGVKQS